MGVGQELTNGLKGVGHVFSFMLKQKKSPTPLPPPPHINNDQSLRKGKHNLISFAKFKKIKLKIKTTKQNKTKKHPDRKHPKQVAVFKTIFTRVCDTRK